MSITACTTHIGAREGSFSLPPPLDPPLTALPTVLLCSRHPDRNTILVPQERTYSPGTVVLTGLLCKVPLRPEQIPDPTTVQTLRQNLQIAHRVNKGVRDMIPCSPNFPARTPMGFDCTLADRVLHTIRAQSSDGASVLASVNLGIGQCREMTLAAYVIARSIVSCICASIARGDHSFLIIGEQPNEVVCDPWSGAVYPWQEHGQYLRSMVGVTRDAQTVVEPFRPNHHSVVYWLPRGVQ